jgi:hypothetical protein
VITRSHDSTAASACCEIASVKPASTKASVIEEV